jgi:serine protease
LTTAHASRRRLLAIIAWSGPVALVLAYLTPTSAQNQGTAFGGLPYAPRMTRDQVVARIQALHDRMPYVPGEALVRFRAGFAGTQQLRALSALRGGGLSSARWIGNTLLVRSDSEPNARLMADVLARQPEVEWAQPNYLRHLHVVPNDTSFSRQWNMPLINMPQAWDISHGGSSSVTVAVVDSGVTQVSATFAFALWTGTQIQTVPIRFGQNPDIAAIRFFRPQDFAFWNGPVLDMYGHGTQVAGTILQETNNNLGFAGIAYNARLMPVKVCIGMWESQFLRSAMNLPGYIDPADPRNTGCFDSDVADGVRYAADSGAQVINISLGGPGESPVLLDAIRYAVQKGVFVAMSAGNDFEDGNPVNYPAGYGPQIDGAMAVGAVGRSRRRAFYSSTGSYIEIAAPGGDSRDGGADGVIYQEGLLFSDSNSLQVVPSFDHYTGRGDQGTSFASPHIAGVAALLYAQGIKKPAAIEAAIKRFAVDLGTPGRDDEYGYGMVDARATLRGLGVAK